MAWARAAALSATDRPSARRAVSTIAVSFSWTSPSTITTCQSAASASQRESTSSSARISAAKLQAKIGRTLPVIIDEVGEADEDGDIGATGQSEADAPEIDGNVFLRNVSASLASGDIVDVMVEDADEHDLFGVPSEKV